MQLLVIDLSKIQAKLLHYRHIESDRLRGKSIPFCQRHLSHITSQYLPDDSQKLEPLPSEFSPDVRGFSSCKQPKRGSGHLAGHGTKPMTDYNIPNFESDGLKFCLYSREGPSNPSSASVWFPSKIAKIEFGLIPFLKVVEVFIPLWNRSKIQELSTFRPISTHRTFWLHMLAFKNVEFWCEIFWEKSTWSKLIAMS